jgi:carbonic anhydrase/acetyltransferase-like protein (isoleucine patch superfamily)
VPTIEEGAYVHPDAVVIGAVTIRAEASIWPGAVLRGDYGSIEVGRRTSIQDGTVVHATAELPTRIGAGVVVGAFGHPVGVVLGGGQSGAGASLGLGGDGGG